MKLIVIGATGGVGRHLVDAALAQGHHVTAASRNPGKMALQHEQLRVQPCDALNKGSVNQAIAGHDVVLATLGSTSKGPTTLYSQGARNILDAMQTNGVQRLVFLSNFGILNERASDLRGSALLFLIKRAIRHTLVDHVRAFEHIKAYAAEWVVVRPMILTNGPRIDRYRIARDGLPASGLRVSRADVAHFMLRQATGTEYLNQCPSIAY